MIRVVEMIKVDQMKRWGKRFAGKPEMSRALQDFYRYRSMIHGPRCNYVSCSNWFTNNIFTSFFFAVDCNI